MYNRPQLTFSVWGLSPQTENSANLMTSDLREWHSNNKTRAFQAIQVKDTAMKVNNKTEYSALHCEKVGGTVHWVQVSVPFVDVAISISLRCSTPRILQKQQTRVGNPRLRLFSSTGAWRRRRPPAGAGTPTSVGLTWAAFLPPTAIPIPVPTGMANPIIPVYNMWRASHMLQAGMVGFAWMTELRPSLTGLQSRATEKRPAATTCACGRRRRQGQYRSLSQDGRLALFRYLVSWRIHPNFCFRMISCLGGFELQLLRGFVGEHRVLLFEKSFIL